MSTDFDGEDYDVIIRNFVAGVQKAVRDEGMTVSLLRDAIIGLGGGPADITITHTYRSGDNELPPGAIVKGDQLLIDAVDPLKSRVIINAKA